MISFVSVFPPYRGGISNFSDYLYRHLNKKTDVTPINFKVLYPDFLFPGATQYLESDAAIYSERKLHSYNPFNWNKTAAQITDSNPDVLLFSFWHPFFIPAFNHIIKKVKKQNPQIQVCTVAHNVKPHENFPFSKKLLTSFFSKNDLVIVLSEQTKIEFNKLNILTSVIKIFHPVYSRKVPDTPKVELRKKYGVTDGDKVPLFFGLIRDYKGLDVLIQALNKLDLNSLNIRPFIVGEFYTDKSKYLDLIKYEHVEQYKIIDRFVSQEEANELFTIADALILPYKTASQSGVFNDALNFKLPAIVSNQPGLIEHISNNESGMIFESENVSQLSSMLEDFFTSNRLKDNISSNLTALKEQLSWENFTLKLMDELEIKT